MNITHYHKALRLETGGVVRAVLDLSTAMATAGHTVTVLTNDATDAPDDWRRETAGVPHVVPLGPLAQPGGRLAKDDVATIRQRLEKTDVLHLHGMWVPSNAALARLAAADRVPVVQSVHGMLDDWSMEQKSLKKRVYMRLVARKLLESAAAVHCTAQAELDQARRWFPRGHGVVVPLIMDLSGFETLPGPGPARAAFPVLDRGRPTLLFLSRIHYKKGIERLLDAAATLVDTGYPDLLVVLAGTGDDAYVRTLQTHASRLGLDDNVLFAGFVSGVEKVSMYQAADVFVLPTSQENFGFVLFEALAARAPVVTTRGTDTWPEMEASGGAVVVETDPAAIATATTSLLRDAERRRSMGEAGREWVFANLSAARVGARYEAMYAEAAEAAKTGR